MISFIFSDNRLALIRKIRWIEHSEVGLVNLRRIADFIHRL